MIVVVIIIIIITIIIITIITIVYIITEKKENLSGAPLVAVLLNSFSVR